MSEPEDALQREWVAACTVLVLVLVGSVGGFLWFGLKPAQLVTAPTPAPVATQNAASQVSTPAQQFCASALTVAQNFGVMSADTKPASEPQKTDIKGRYVCLANGAQGQYTISVDLVCRDLSDEHCFDLFSVTGSDGTSLFQRQE